LADNSSLSGDPVQMLVGDNVGGFGNGCVEVICRFRPYKRIEMHRKKAF
jgi:hypothetical protein